MDKDAADDGADARGVLASWLDDYTAGRCDRAQMQASFLEICRGNPEAPWDALALLDQYQRRGRVDVALARSLKSDIAQLVFGVANQTDNEEAGEPAPEADDVAPSRPARDDAGAAQARPEAPRSEPPGRQPAASQNNAQNNARSNVETNGGDDTTGTRWRKLAAQRKLSAGAEESFADPTQFRRDFDPPTRSPITDRATPASSVLRDRYELLAILGRGSSGTVYKALDRHRANLAASAQCVALKVLKSEALYRGEALAQLEHEFHQAQSLSHPNIVSMFDLDRDRDTYFLVMELLEGELLSDILRRLDHHGMSRSQALAIVGSIGAALAHAHRRDVVHADLKPRNVMITTSGEVKVLDFGFARTQALEPYVGDMRDDVLGGSRTPAYASAERVNGEPADSSDDVYSLACIAYELLSGRHPYGGRSATLARAHGRDPQRIPGLNGRQWNALRTALHWSRADRRIDVVELIAALGCTDVPQALILPHQLFDSDADDGGGFTRRRLAVGSLLALVAVIAGAIFWSERWLPREPAVDVAAGRVDEAQNTVIPPQTAPASVNLQQPAGPPRDPTTIPSSRETAPAARQSNAPATAPVTTPPAATQKTPAAKPEVSATAKPAATKPQTVEEQATASEQAAAAAPSMIQFDKDTYVASEGDGMVKLTVKRTGSTKREAVFRWSLQPNSAEAGSDYAAIGPLTERMPPGARTAVLTVPLVDDKIKERTEMFMVELNQEEGGPAIGPQARAVVIIVDDD
jgi:serine/threonine protein kinase